MSGIHFPLDRVTPGESLALLREMPDESVDALVTDGPYSSGGYVRGDRAKPVLTKYLEDESPWQGSRGFMGDNRDQRSWCYWNALWLSECHRIVRLGGYAGLFADWRQVPAATDSLQAGGFIWRGIVTWDKGEGARAPHTGYHRHQGEFYVWGSKGPLAPCAHGGPFPGVIRVTIKPSEKYHPTGKPVELMRELVRVVSPGGLVLDPFAGSGSTLRAALLEGRHGIGFELDPLTARDANAIIEAESGGLTVEAATAGQRAMFGGAP